MNRPYTPRRIVMDIIDVSVKIILIGNLMLPFLKIGLSTIFTGR
ncbi:MAG: hypothetical protein FD130_790 [Halothiobacillaceae bacterium]|nr:MAG: hypothetical protein FD130_790 [Halothiobacillaceae bacterium]